MSRLYLWVQRSDNECNLVMSALKQMSIIYLPPFETLGRPVPAHYLRCVLGQRIMTQELVKQATLISKYDVNQPRVGRCLQSERSLITLQDEFTITQNVSGSKPYTPLRIYKSPVFFIRLSADVHSILPWDLHRWRQIHLLPPESTRGLWLLLHWHVAYLA